MRLEAPLAHREHHITALEENPNDRKKSRMSPPFTCKLHPSINHITQSAPFRYFHQINPSLIALYDTFHFIFRDGFFFLAGHHRYANLSQILALTISAVQGIFNFSILILRSVCPGIRMCWRSVGGIWRVNELEFQVTDQREDWNLEGGTGWPSEKEVVRLSLRGSRPG